MKKVIFFYLLSSLAYAQPFEERMERILEENRMSLAQLWPIRHRIKNASMSSYVEYDTSVKDINQKFLFSEQGIRFLKNFVYGEVSLRSKVVNFVAGLTGHHLEYPFNTSLHLAMEQVSPSLIRFLIDDRCINDAEPKFFYSGSNTKEEKEVAYRVFIKKKKSAYAHLLKKNNYKEHALHFIPQLNIQTIDPNIESSVWKEHKKNFYRALRDYLLVLKKNKQYLFDSNEESWELFFNAVDRNGKTILEKAVEYNDDVLVRLYHTFDITFQNPDILMQSLKDAIVHKKHAFFRALLLHAKESLLSQSIQDGYWDRKQNSLLHYAALHNNHQAIVALLDSKIIDPTRQNVDGDTFLHLLVKNIHMNLVQYIEHGSNSIKRSLDNLVAKKLDIDSLLSLNNNQGESVFNAPYNVARCLNQSQLEGLQGILVQIMSGAVHTDKDFFERTTEKSKFNATEAAITGRISDIEKYSNEANYKEQDAEGNTFLHQLIYNFYKDISRYILVDNVVLKTAIEHLQKNSKLAALLDVSNNEGLTVLQIVKAPLSQNIIFNQKNIEQLRNALYSLVAQKEKSKGDSV